MVVRGLVGVSAPSSFRYHTYMLDQLRNIQKTLNTIAWALLTIALMLAIDLLGADLKSAWLWLVENAKLLKQ